MIAELDEANKRITDLRKKLQLTKEYNEAVASMDEASKSKDENLQHLKNRISKQLR